MKKFFYVAIAATALASCSSDNLVDLKEGDEIKITAVADNDSRAADVWCNNNKPADFRVWANSGSKAFMADELYKEDGAVYTSDVVRYWPEEAAVDFYGLKYVGDVTYASGGVPSIVNYSPATNADEQQDIIYATTPAQTKAVGTVPMNFRHALSQVEFMAVNNNPTIKVFVKNVRVGNAVGQGTFTLPTSTTDDNFEDETHGTTTTPTTPTGTFNQGVWTYPTTAVYSTYTVATQAHETALTDEASSLTLSTGDAITSTTDHETESIKESLMLIPTGTEATTPWNPTSTIDATTGSYLGIDVVIQNIVTVEDVEYATEIYSGWAYVPASFNWVQGKRYVYTFSFSAGNDGGYRADGTPVLENINLSVTVDDFVWGGETIQEMVTE